MRKLGIAEKSQFWDFLIVPLYELLIYLHRLSLFGLPTFSNLRSIHPDGQGPQVARHGRVHQKLEGSRSAITGLTPSDTLKCLNGSQMALYHIADLNQLGLKKIGPFSTQILRGYRHD